MSTLLTLESAPDPFYWHYRSITHLSLAIVHFLEQWSKF